jgi:hypothetical protein
MSERTPGPWKIYDDSNDFHVMIMGKWPSSGGAHVADVLRRENAAAIVLWENHFDELVNALEQIANQQYTGGGEILAMTKIARDALAKVKS